MTKTQKALLASGIVNALHGILHLLQALQSFYLAGSFDSDWIHSFLESPITAGAFAFMGGVTIYIGIKDFYYHKQ